LATTRSDRHGIVTPSAGLMNPNHFLAVAIVTCSPIGRSGGRKPPSAKRWSAAALLIAW
jgi:phosphoglucomutase